MAATLSLSGSSLMQVDQCLGSGKLFIRPASQSKMKPQMCRRPLTVRAGAAGTVEDHVVPVSVGGFVLGGIVVGTLGCVYAPQISKALAGADRKDLMRKLPKFIYDEEKALEGSGIII